MELAANGTDRTVNEYTSDVNYASNAVDDDHSPYVMMAERFKDTPFQLFAFGKAVGSKRGRSLLLLSLRVVQISLLHCISGSKGGRSLDRQLITHA